MFFMLFIGFMGSVSMFSLAILLVVIEDKKKKKNRKK